MLEPKDNPDVLVLRPHPEVSATMWDAWTDWAGNSGAAVLPADPEDLALYLAQTLGHTPGTFAPEIALAVISAVHRDAGHPDPVYDPRVGRAVTRMATANRGPHTNPLSVRMLNNALIQRQTARSPREIETAMRASLVFMLARETTLDIRQLAELTRDHFRYSEDAPQLEFPGLPPQPVSHLLFETARGEGPLFREDTGTLLGVSDKGVTPLISRLARMTGASNRYSHRSGFSGAMLDLLTTTTPNLPERYSGNTALLRRDALQIAIDMEQRPLHP